MAGQTNYETSNVKTYGAAPEQIDFYLVGAGSGALTFGAGCPSGMIVSATHTATGTFTVVMNQTIYKVINWECNPDDLASPDASWATLGNFANEASTTGLQFQLTFYTPGGSYAQVPTADPAVGRKIRIRLRVQRSNWGKMT